MNSDYLETYTSEIFTASQCIWHENTLMDFFRHNLIALGYTAADDSNKVWRRGDRVVVICLVDDYTTCSNKFEHPVSFQFDRNVTVITDNLVSTPTQYRVLKLPETFYGIYSHEPQDQTWTPERRLNFSVRRIDARRLRLWLELVYRNEQSRTSHITDLVNFDAWEWQGDNATPEGRQQSFFNVFNTLRPEIREVYESTAAKAGTLIPYRNHNLSLERQFLSAWVNLVVETYSSDDVVALSEKTFRALCLPAPWMLFCGKNSVAYLSALGFDILADLVDHRSDSLGHHFSYDDNDKSVVYVWDAKKLAQDLQERDLPQLKHRLATAATHNQQLLREFKNKWPRDFAVWWTDAIQRIA